MQRHDLDAVSLVSGLLFTSLGLASLLGWVDAGRVDAWWLLPIGGIGAGVVWVVWLLRGQARSGLRSRDTEFMQ